MKYTMKWIVSIMSIMLFLTSASIAEKKFVPIIMDDMISFASYYTTTNNLKIPILSYENEYKDLVIQCEDNIAYFIMAYESWNNKPSVFTSAGTITIEKEGTIDGTSYIKGYIDGTKPIDITSEIYNSYDNTLSWKVTRRCRKNSTSGNKLNVPTFNGNSQGKLVVQCESDVVYYIMAYDCLRSWTNPTASTNNGNLIIDEKRHVGEIFYVKGHVKRTSGSVTITGKLLNEFDTRTWTQTCP